MLDERNRKQVLTRLKRIQGQVSGIARMVEEDRYCVDVMTQVSAVVSALRGVEDMVMRSHLNTCVTEAIQGDDEGEKQSKITELMDVIGKFRKHG